jgi:hypothetical protein
VFEAANGAIAGNGDCEGLCVGLTPSQRSCVNSYDYVDATQCIEAKSCLE